MAFRTTGVFKVAASNTPQPLFGSWITAASYPIGAPTSSPVTLTLGTALNAGNDASMFQPNEAVWIINPTGLLGETAYLLGGPTGNTVTLRPQPLVTFSRHPPVTQQAHTVGAIGVGSFIIPKQMLNNFLVQYEDGGTGPFLYLGNSPIMTTVLNRFFKLSAAVASAQPAFYNASMASPGNPFDLSELFVVGTIGDKWCASLIID